MYSILHASSPNATITSRCNIILDNSRRRNTESRVICMTLKLLAKTTSVNSIRRETCKVHKRITNTTCVDIVQNPAQQKGKQIKPCDNTPVRLFVLICSFTKVSHYLTTASCPRISPSPVNKSTTESGWQQRCKLCVDMNVSESMPERHVLKCQRTSRVHPTLRVNHIVARQCPR
jgi:hypothetical protein